MLGSSHLLLVGLATNDLTGEHPSFWRIRLGNSEHPFLRSFLVDETVKNWDVPAGCYSYASNNNLLGLMSPAAPIW
jgi:hypothetical protein